MAAPISSKKPDVRLEIPRDGMRLVTKALLGRVLRAAFRQLGVTLQIDGADAASTGADGTQHFKINAAGAADECAHQWQPRAVSSTSITLSPGTITIPGVADPVVPTLGGDPLTDDPPPELTVDDTDLNIIYLKVSVTLTTSNGFVTGYTHSAAIIVCEATTQTSTDSIRYFELFRWQANTLVSTTRRFNIGLMARDTGAGTTTAEWLDWTAAS